MKKLFLFLLLPTIAMTIHSCSKGEDDQDDDHDVRLLKTISSDSGSVEFVYDNLQRIIKVIWSDQSGNPDLIDSYEYKSYSVYNVVEVNNKWGYRIGFMLDGNGYVVGEVYGDGSKDHQYTDGYLTSSRDGRVYTWENANLTKIANLHDDTYTYAYNNVVNKLNVNIFDLDGFGFGYLIHDDGDTCTHFKGTSSRNYPVTATIGDDTVTYTYTYDSKGYPTKIAISRHKLFEEVGYTLTYY